MTLPVDVVIPTLNAASTVAATIAAARAEATASITICDGGSRDGTTDIATKAGATVMFAPPGRGSQLAAAAASGHAPWLLFLHADTVPGAGWADAIRAFIATPGNDGKAGYFELRFASSDPRARRVERLARWRSRTLGLPYGDQGLLIGRAFYRRLGGFRPLPLMEDVDLVRRIGRSRLVPLSSSAQTSAVRYERDGWLARPLKNLACLSLYCAGVPTRAIARLYGR